MFLLVPKDGEVEPAAALVDSGRPRLYRTFNYEEYRELLVSTKSFMGEALSLLAADWVLRNQSLIVVASST